MNSTMTKDELVDKMEEELRFKGCGYYGSTSYKLIMWAYDDNDSPAIERVHNGNREIFVGNAYGRFQTFDSAIEWARFDAKFDLS